MSTDNIARTLRLVFILVRLIQSHEYPSPLASMTHGDRMECAFSLADAGSWKFSQLRSPTGQSSTANPRVKPLPRSLWQHIYDKQLSVLFIVPAFPPSDMHNAMSLTAVLARPEVSWLCLAEPVTARPADMQFLSCAACISPGQQFTEWRSSSPLLDCVVFWVEKLAVYALCLQESFNLVSRGKAYRRLKGKQRQRWSRGICFCPGEFGGQRGLDWHKSIVYF